MTLLTVTQTQASQWATIVTVSGWENDDECTGRFFHTERIFGKWADASAAYDRVKETGMRCMR